MDKQKLLEELKVDTLLNIKQAEFFKTLTIDKLNFKSNDAQWSILECVEHLNRYGRFYIPEISQKIKNNKYPNSNEFKSGILGDYFAKSMQPKEKINKMKNEAFYDLIDNRINQITDIFKENVHLKKQNENGRKSFSFLFWFLERYLPNKELSEFENYITEGNDDSSCDIIFNNVIF